MSTDPSSTEPMRPTISLVIPVEAARGLRSGIGAELQLVAKLEAHGMGGRTYELRLECDQSVIEPMGIVRRLEIDREDWNKEVVVPFTTTAATKTAARIRLRADAGGLVQFAGCSLDVIGCSATPTVAQDPIVREDDNIGGK